MLDLQKASIWKRISAFLFDGIVLAIAVVGIAFLLSVLLRFDSYNDGLQEAYAKYEAQYGIGFELSAEEYNAMTKEEFDRYNEAYQALVKDERAMYDYNMVVSLTLLISTVGIFLAFFLLEFLVPLKLRNGQTLGKKIFGVAVMRVDGVQINGPLLFVRAVLGKYTLETMIPVFLIVMIFFNMIGILGTLLLGLILLLQVILIIVTPTNSLIHDLLAKTVTVDFASQRIFESEEDLIGYKKRVHAEKVAKQTY